MSAHGSPRLRWITAPITVYAFIHVALLLFFTARCNVTVESAVQGHDGGEYMSFATALSRGSLAGVPADSRRHDPGWPIALAVVAQLPKPAIAGWLLTLACTAGALLYGARWLFQAGFNSTEVQRWTWAMVLGYPAQVYYGCFVLSEPLFVLLVLCSLFCFSNSEKPGWRIPAYLLAAIAALVRGPGLLLAAAYAIYEIIAERRTVAALWPRRIASALAGLTLSIVPYAAWTLLARHAWSADGLFVHQPRFGFPFSGFAGWQQIGIARAAYIVACIAFVMSSVVLLAQRAFRPVSHPQLQPAAMFCGLYLFFHLCLRSLHYIDRDVLTFNYQDRYYVGILPFLLVPWLSKLRWWILLPAGLLSVILSAYWGIHYFAAARSLH
jgi:hypothetical protein